MSGLQTFFDEDFGYSKIRELIDPDFEIGDRLVPHLLTRTWAGSVRPKVRKGRKPTIVIPRIFPTTEFVDQRERSKRLYIGLDKTGEVTDFPREQILRKEHFLSVGGIFKGTSHTDISRRLRETAEKHFPGYRWRRRGDENVLIQEIETDDFFLALEARKKEPRCIRAYAIMGFNAPEEFAQELDSAAERFNKRYS